MALNHQQEEVLTRLLDKWERTKECRSSLPPARVIRLLPQDVMKNYHDDGLDPDDVKLFHQHLEDLREAGYVTLLWEKGSAYHSVLRSIDLNPSALDRVYQALGRENLAARTQREIDCRKALLGKSPITDRFLLQQIDLLSDFRNPQYTKEENEVLVPLLLFILENRTEMMERELSMHLFGNSKTFESWKSRACRILRTFGDDDLPEDMSPKDEQDLLLSEHLIYSNPSYVYLKGHCRLVFEGEEAVTLTGDTPFAFSSQALSRLKGIEILDSTLMTVENLTSYHRMQLTDTTFVYLGGYHNSAKSAFLRRIAQDHPRLRFFHFGDLDPDGFMILEHLKRKTGVDFLPWHMDAEDLVRYQPYEKELEEQDRKKLRTLLEEGKYIEPLTWMLEHGRKLEQEIISWDLYEQRQRASIAKKEDEET
ncbi:MAG: DUF2399 domain-containing protein [Clostridia bacterium]|nr:DUF2399 domain-containing protein [Clostridia bacterium]